MNANHPIVDKLAELAGRGTVFLTIRTRTDARLKKKGNPYGQVWKESVVHGYVNFDYGAGVNRRRAKEGNSDPFKIGSSWHVPVKDSKGRWSPCCAHKANGSLYLRFAFLKNLSDPVYVSATAGHTIPKEMLAPWMPAPSSYARQELDDPLIFLTYSLDSILELRARVGESGSEETVYSATTDRGRGEAGRIPGYGA